MLHDTLIGHDSGEHGCLRLNARARRVFRQVRCRDEVIAREPIEHAHGVQLEEDCLGL